jgi:hypothetical protein
MLNNRYSFYLNASKKDIDKIAELKEISPYIFIHLENNKIRGFLVIFEEKYNDIRIVKMKLNSQFENFPNSHVENLYDISFYNFPVDDIYNVDIICDISRIPDIEKYYFLSLNVKYEICSYRDIFFQEGLNIFSNILKNSTHSIFVCWITGDHYVKNTVAKNVSNCFKSTIIINNNSLNDYRGEECVIWNYDGKSSFPSLYEKLDRKGHYLNNGIYFKPYMFLIVTNMSLKKCKEELIYLGKSLYEYKKITERIQCSVDILTYGCNCVKVHKCDVSQESIDQVLVHTFNEINDRYRTFRRTII